MKVAKGDGCWLWKAGHNSRGYGTFNPVNYGPAVNAHRFAYELLVGPIPDGMTIDHLCGTRDCVNAAHMVLASLRDNILRSGGFSAVNAAKTHCPQGHEYTPDNTYVCSRNMRSCKECRRIRSQVWRATH